MDKPIKKTESTSEKEKNEKLMDDYRRFLLCGTY